MDGSKIEQDRTFRAPAKSGHEMWMGLAISCWLRKVVLGWVLGVCRGESGFLDPEERDEKCESDGSIEWNLCVFKVLRSRVRLEGEQ
jgi:hypothetical protein